MESQLGMKRERKHWPHFVLEKPDAQPQEFFGGQRTAYKSELKNNRYPAAGTDWSTGRMLFYREENDGRDYIL